MKNKKKKSYPISFIEEYILFIIASIIDMIVLVNIYSNFSHDLYLILTYKMLKAELLTKLYVDKVLEII